ncbi:MAG: MobA/MobL family protein, partial [Caulobacteraceae bacterium]|nr:MobA/MobL family protein [Caulobacteraceae bacterium]
MASYLCRVQTIKRAAGRSAVAAAAYRSGQALVDERLAMEFDFAGKAGVEFSEIRLPEGAPPALADRQTLWNAVEQSEARKDAVPARELLLALPHELDFEQRNALVRDFVDRHVTARGMVADIAWHVPGQEGDQRNFHAHILLSTRRLTPDGFGAKDPAWRTPQQVRDWRAGWAEIQNEHLRRRLGPGAPQVSHLTLAEQGVDRTPTEHLGPSATALERQNERTSRGERNRDIEARNAAVRDARRDYADTADRLADGAPKIEAPIDQLVAEARRVRESLAAERAGWEAEQTVLKGVRAPTEKAVEREVLGADEAALRRARGRLSRTETRVRRVRARRLELVAWIRNPARMIWAKHAELNALA